MSKKCGFILFFVIIEISHALSPNLVFAKNKTEEIYIWKLSDELKLSTKEEQTFSEYIRDINKKRMTINQSIQENIQQMSKVKSKNEQEKLLNQHKSLLKKFSELNLDEVEKISKLLGPEKGVQYFVLKNEMNSRFKELLLTSDRKKEITTPPKIIEQ